MKETKFRLWDNENKCYYEPTFEAYKGNLEEVMLVSTSGHLVMRKLYEFNHESLFPGRFEKEEYTTIKDTDDKEIYENDVVRIESTVPGGVDMVGKVVWLEGGWTVEDQYNQRAVSLFRETEYIFLIGNSHEDLPF